jgi:hypothetical protein
MFPRTPCDSCPRAAAGLDPPCYAQTSGHKRFCELAAAGDERYTALLVGPAPAPTPTPTLPGLVAQAVNFGKAIVSHVAAGMPRASAEVVAARLAICEACPHLIRPDYRCGLLPGQGAQGGGCGCYVRTKAAWADQTCPAGKWPGPGHTLSSPPS